MWSIVTNRGNNPIIPKLAMDVSRSLSVIPSMSGLMATRGNGASRTIARRHQQMKGLSLLRSNFQPYHTSPSSFQLSHTIQARSFSQPPGGMNLGNIFNNTNGQANSKPGETLAQYGIDLTSLAQEGKLDPGQFYNPFSFWLVACILFVHTMHPSICLQSDRETRGDT
jgi:hypothetical protein